MKVTCPRCKNEPAVYLYYYDAQITTHQYIPMNINSIEHTARVKGKAICPFCGVEIVKTFDKVISKEDIIRLAVPEEDL